MEQKTPKYTVEQLLEAIQASHLHLVVKEVDGNNVKVGIPCQKPITIESDSNGVRAIGAWNMHEAHIIGSLQTALHILFNSNEVIY